MKEIKAVEKCGDKLRRNIPRPCGVNLGNPRPHRHLRRGCVLQRPCRTNQQNRVACAIYCQPVPSSYVDEKLPAGQLLILGLQHVLVMYGGDVAVPLLVSEALHLPIRDKALLINCGLFASGIATIIQSLGVWRFGARMPVMMGATFVSV